LRFIESPKNFSYFKSSTKKDKKRPAAEAGGAGGNREPTFLPSSSSSRPGRPGREGRETGVAKHQVEIVDSGAGI
jgi:hypothetical protein